MSWEASRGAYKISILIGYSSSIELSYNAIRVERRISILHPWTTMRSFSYFPICHIKNSALFGRYGSQRGHPWSSAVPDPVVTTVGKNIIRCIHTVGVVMQEDVTL